MDPPTKIRRRGAEDLEDKLRQRGMAAQRVPIDADALVAWCRTQHKAVDTMARADYVNEILRSTNPPLRRP